MYESYYISITYVHMMFITILKPNIHLGKTRFSGKSFETPCYVNIHLFSTEKVDDFILVDSSIWSWSLGNVNLFHRRPAILFGNYSLKGQGSGDKVCLVIIHSTQLLMKKMIKLSYRGHSSLTKFLIQRK